MDSSFPLDSARDKRGSDICEGAVKLIEGFFNKPQGARWTFTDTHPLLCKQKNRAPCMTRLLQKESECNYSF